MYQVFARKWRPQTFDELVGQPHVARTLSNAIKADRLAHAYIFAGLRGTGKTTVARILAKCLNCETGPTTTPCNECAACSEIGESRAIDVLEIDAASRTKVEQTRELLEVVGYAPVRDRNKILIIDEAHMLSKASFNALLKTLEEPPPNVVFLLATTELQRILPTILSRCQVFEFRRVAAAEVAAHLRTICDDEKITISDSALERLARGGEGSVRDSLSLLERAVAFCGSEIDDEDVLRMLGAVRARVLADLVSALARRDAAGMLNVLDSLVDEGQDLVHFWNAMISAIRDLLLMRTLDDCGDALARPSDDAAELLAAAEGLSREDLTRVFQILADLEPGLKSSSQPRYLFEATLIRLAGLGAVRPIEEILATLGSGAGEGRTVAPANAAPAARTRPTPKAAPAALPKKETPEPARDAAAAILDGIHRERPMIGAMLAQASEFRLESGELIITFPASMKAVKRQIDTRETLAMLRTEAERMAGGRVEIRIEVGQETELPAGPPSGGAAAAAPEPPEQPIPHPAENDAPSEATTASQRSGGLLEQARAEPGVQKLMDVFGAHVVEIRSHDKPTENRKSRGRKAPPAEDSP